MSYKFYYINFQINLVGLHVKQFKRVSDLTVSLSSLPLLCFTKQKKSLQFQVSEKIKIKVNQLHVNRSELCKNISYE